MDVQASQLNRVIACNGSISMEASPASIELPTDDREDGLAAHHVATAVLTGMITDPLEYVERATPNGIYVTPEMAEYVAIYTDNISDMSYVGEAQIGVEQSIDFQIGTTGYVCRARSDWFAFDTDDLTLYIKDFKYGFRIVEPEGNWTLIAYAIGICARFGYKPNVIVFEIVQPRPHHRDGPVRKWSISAGELAAFYLVMVSTFERLDQNLHTGEHCRGCKALAICDAAKRAGYNSIEAASVVFTDLLTGDALANEIRTLRRASKMIEAKLTAYEELAIHQIDSSTLGAGQTVPGMHVEMGLGNRTFNGGLTPEVLSVLVGKPVEELTTRKTITPAALERLGVPEQVVNSISYRPTTKRKLIEYDANKAAKRLGFTS